MRRYIIIALVLCVLVGVASAWGASMGAWDYRKEITINNTGAELTNYQVMFTVNRSAGSDSGFTVFLNGKCESDYDDIRFTTSNEETFCDYWIESSSSTVASVWVEVPTIAAGDTTLYLYYGNAGAAAVSDGNATFSFFDDFDTYDTATKWTTAAGTPTSSGGKLVLDGTDMAGTKATYGEGYALRAKCDVQNTNYGIVGFDSDGTPIARISYNYPDVNVHQAHQQLTGYPGSKASFGALGSTTRIFDIRRRTSTSVIYSVDGTDYTLTTNYPTGALQVRLGYVQSVWWVLVRQYTATEPTVSAWGSEETPIVGSVTSAFSALPLTGNIPLTVYFTDASTGNNCTVDAWQWSFGDSSPNSTQQNPAHTYTTTGLFNVILTAFNTSYSKKDTEAKTAYINATYDPSSPVADFTVTETCGDVGDTFYFIDFSTGGGLYAWNWSFGDGSYSELRNPTHQYASNGTYDVNLSVWGAYGNDSLLRENLITIPCGAPTPTPTPTVTPTGGGNVTEGNVTYIYAPDQDYVPFPIWLALVIITIALFGHSLIFLKNSDLTAILAALFALISAWLSNMIGYIDVQVTSYAEEIVISPLIQAVHPPWLVYTMLIFAFVSVMNIFAAIYKVYLKPVPWNEIYDRKLPKWERRK